MTTDSICFESLRIHSIFFLVFARDPVVFFCFFGTLCLFYCCCFIYTNTLATLAASTTALHTQLWPIACLLCTPSDAATPTPTPPPTATHIWRAVGGGGWEQLLLSVQFHSRAALCIFKMIIRRFPSFPRFFLFFCFFLFFICASVQVICVCWGPPGSWEQPMGHSLIASRHGNDARALLATNKNRQAHAHGHAHACLSGRVESES